MKRLNIIIITILICALSQAQNPPYRNGQRLTDYNFPLFGDVKTIEYTCFSINTDTGEEYPRDTTIIRFNKNGDVEYINPYVDLTYTDVVYPAELRFLYNNLGYNTLTREVIDYDYMDVVYDTYYTYDEDWRRIKGEIYNEDGKLLYTEEYTYDRQGNLTHEKSNKGGELVVYTYDTNMNIILIERYIGDKLVEKTNRTYNENGKLIQETTYSSNRLNEMEISETTLYSYGENGVLISSETKSPIHEMFLQYITDSRTEITDRTIYKCDSYGNVIEETYYPNDSTSPQFRIEYKISYR